MAGMPLIIICSVKINLRPSNNIFFLRSQFSVLVYQVVDWLNHESIKQICLARFVSVLYISCSNSLRVSHTINPSKIDKIKYQLCHLVDGIIRALNVVHSAFFSWITLNWSA